MKTSLNENSSSQYLIIFLKLKIVTKMLNKNDAISGYILVFIFC
jgi:hypothetical protein